MSKATGVHLEMDVNKVNARWPKLAARARAWLKNEVVKDSEPFVPFRANNGGTLTRSVRPSIGTQDSRLVYNTVYAARMYYGEGLHFSKARHPQATHHWFEKAKAINKPKWVKGAQAEWGGKI